MNGNDDPSAELRRLQEENLLLKVEIAKRENAALQETLARAPAQNAPAGSAAAVKRRPMLRGLLTLVGYAGRLNRTSYLLGTLLLLLTNLAPIVLWDSIARGSSPTVPAHGIGAAEGVVLGVLVLWGGVAASCFFAFQVKRLHDADAPGWWVAVAASVITIGSALMNMFFESHNVTPSKFGSVAFMAGLWAIILAAIPGTPAANGFGPPPTRRWQLCGDLALDEWIRSTRELSRTRAPKPWMRNELCWGAVVFGTLAVLLLDPNVHAPKNDLQFAGVIGQGTGTFIWMWGIGWAAWRVSWRSEAAVFATIVTVIDLSALADRMAT